MRRITPGEAVAILKVEDERGHVQRAFFKDAMLERFYAICNCGGAMQAHLSGTPMLASSGYISQVGLDFCIDCGVCTSKCTQGALRLARDDAKGIPLDICSLMEETRMEK